VRDDSIPADLVELALWMATEYCSTPARALGLVMPPPREDGAVGRADGRRRA
jgi:primosomal protein N' (replication factor Y)